MQRSTAIAGHGGDGGSRHARLPQHQSLYLSAGIFLASSAWFVASGKRRRARARASRRMEHCGTVITARVRGEDDHNDDRAVDDDDENDDNDDDDAGRYDYYGVGGVASGRVASRGVGALTPVRPYLQTFFLCLQDPCDPERNPTGHVALCVAENKLVQEMLARRLMGHPAGTAIAAFSDSTVYSYNGFLGLPGAREAVAYFLAVRFLRVDLDYHSTAAGPAMNGEHHGSGGSPQPAAATTRRRSIDPEHVALGSGAGSLLNHLFFSLAEPGDAVLIPAPYYAAFENDMKVVARCVPFPVQMVDPVRGPTPADLDAALFEARKAGLRCKILLLNNPNNPLGVYYRPGVVRDAVGWARSRGMHTIVDEVYALSVHDPDGDPFDFDPDVGADGGGGVVGVGGGSGGGGGFQSVIRVLDNDLGDDVHMVWALSKDFGACGFRVGVLYTQNNLLLQALANLNIFSGVSHPMQMITAEILCDDAFVDAFLADSRMQLLHSYGICARKLDEMVVPYVPATAGIFVYADFSGVLPERTFDGEARFAKLVERHARVVMTPGGGQRDRKPGMFRICYAWVSPDVLEIAMERLSRLIVRIRKRHWDDLTDESLADVVSSVAVASASAAAGGHRPTDGEGGAMVMVGGGATAAAANLKGLGGVPRGGNLSDF